MNFRHLDNLSVSADFSDCKKFRYRLVAENTDASGEDTVCVIMQNPSMANEERADKSVQFLEKLIFHCNYDVFRNVRKIIIVNQFAFVQTKKFEGLREQIGPKNREFIEEAIGESEIILLAWGKKNPFNLQKEMIYSILQNSQEKIVLKTKKHPSRGTYKDFITKI